MEWLVPYKKELDIEWRLDSTHKNEYRKDEFQDELVKTNLVIRAPVLEVRVDKGYRRQAFQ